MKEKWGESLGASFSFGLLQLLAILLFSHPFGPPGLPGTPGRRHTAVRAGYLLGNSVISATKVIFISAVYHNINGDPVKHFNQQLADNLFTEKKKNGFFNN